MGRSELTNLPPAADVAVPETGTLQPRFMLREQFPSEPATAHELWMTGVVTRLAIAPVCARPRAQQR
ncbi:MAG: hypothetical protein WB421_00310, partial [Terriglobales bacterium]